jgi:hypothetical protein
MTWESSHHHLRFVHRQDQMLLDLWCVEVQQEKTLDNSVQLLLGSMSAQSVGMYEGM